MLFNFQGSLHQTISTRLNRICQLKPKLRTSRATTQLLTGVASLPDSLHTSINTTSRVNNSRLLHDETILFQTSNVAARVGQRNFINFVGVQPNFALSAFEDGGREALLEFKRHCHINDSGTRNGGEFVSLTYARVNNDNCRPNVVTRHQVDEWMRARSRIATRTMRNSVLDNQYKAALPSPRQRSRPGFRPCKTHLRDETTRTDGSHRDAASVTEASAAAHPCMT